MQDRYSLTEAQEMLGVSKSTLESWLRRNKPLTQALKKQRFPDDMRQKFLTQAQLEQLATSHRRQIATPGETDPASRLEALEANYEDHEERIAAIERALDRAGMQLTGPQKAIPKEKQE